MADLSPESIEQQVHGLTYSIPQLTELHAEIALRTIARARYRKIDPLEGEEPEWPLRRRWPHNLGPSIDVPRGWGDVVFTMCEMIFEVCPTARIEVIKPHYGSLKALSMPSGDEGKALYEVVDAAAAVADNICQQCGERGRFRRSPKGWYSIRCDECADEGSWVLFAPPGWRGR